MDSVDYDKNLNSKCVCKKSLPWVNDVVIMAYPCEHLFHSQCAQNTHSKRACQICGENITKFLSITDKDIHPQRFSDILSVTYYSDKCNPNPRRFIDSLLNLLSLVSKIPFLEDKNDGKEYCRQIMALNNVNMKVFGIDKIKNNTKKVFISNHVSLIEFVILYYLLDTGFLASNIAGDSGAVKKFKKIVPIMSFKRGDKKRKINIVEEMRKFVDTHGSICIFPEGIMKNPNSLIRFRSGAFRIGYPIFSIAIKHINVVGNYRIPQFIYNLTSKKYLGFEVHISGPYYPPFDDIAIEKIRKDMAKNAGLLLSRVCSRDVKDT